MLPPKTLILLASTLTSLVALRFTTTYSHAVVVISTTVLMVLEGIPGTDQTVSVSLLLVHLFLTCRLHPSAALGIGAGLLLLRLWRYSELSHHSSILSLGLLFQWFTLYVGLVLGGWLFAEQAGLAGALQDHVARPSSSEISWKIAQNSSQSTPFWGLSQPTITYLSNYWNTFFASSFKKEIEKQFAHWQSSRNAKWFGLHINLMLVGQLMLFLTIAAGFVSDVQWAGWFGSAPGSPELGDSTLSPRNIEQVIQLTAALTLVLASVAVAVSRRASRPNVFRLGSIATLLAFGMFAATFAHTLSAAAQLASHNSSLLPAGSEPLSRLVRLILKSSSPLSIVSGTDIWAFCILMAYALIADVHLAVLGYSFATLSAAGAVSYFWLHAEDGISMLIQLMLVVVACEVSRRFQFRAARMAFALDGGMDDLLARSNFQVVRVTGWQSAMDKDRTLYYFEVGSWEIEEEPELKSAEGSEDEASPLLKETPRPRPNPAKKFLVSALALRERLCALGCPFVVDSAFDSLAGMSGAVAGATCLRLEKLMNRILAHSEDSEFVLGCLFPPGVPQLDITVQTVGSRGDVQPFVALASALERDGHRCRLATHGKFEGFVESEFSKNRDGQRKTASFYPLAIENHPDHWQPETLMRYAETYPAFGPELLTRPGELFGMVSAAPEMQETLETVLLPPGAIVGGKGVTLKPGNSSASSNAGHFGPWMSCVDPETNFSPPSQIPFTSQAVIANPPSYAHIHIAERLGIPLHMVFTMPWSTTKSVGHPLAVQTSGASSFWRQLSYHYMEFIQGRGMSAGISRFRDALGLERLVFSDGVRMERWKVPFSYCFSEILMEKPADWGPWIDVTGFIFGTAVERKKQVDVSATLPPALTAFLESKPFYVGFGSITSDLTSVYRAVFAACRSLPEQTFLIQKGWCDLEISPDEISENVFFVLPPPKHCVVCGANGTATASVKCAECVAAAEFTLNSSETVYAPSPRQLCWEEKVLRYLGTNRCFLSASLPHDYVFSQCRACLHHGGAGTTAAGLSAGLPTVVCAFFGDQLIWGQMLERKGCGQMILARDATAESVAQAIRYCLTPEAEVAAAKIASALELEKNQGAGVERAVDSFYQQLPVELVACEVCLFRKCQSPDSVAVQRVDPLLRSASRYSPSFKLRLCAECAEAVGDYALEPLRTVDWAHETRQPLLKRHFHALMKAVGKLSKRPMQGFEASGWLGFLSGCVLGCVEFAISLIVTPFSLLGAIFSHKLKRDQDLPLRPAVGLSEAERSRTRDAVLEICKIRARIEQTQRSVSTLFNSELLFNNDVKH